MGWHFRLLALLFIGYFALCGWFVKRFPEQPYGDSLSAEWVLQAEHLFLWASLICSTGTYACLTAITLAHASSLRWRWWLTAAASAVYLWMCGGGLVVLLWDDGVSPRTPKGMAQINFFIYLQVVCGFCYAAMLILIYAATARQWGQITPNQSLQQTPAA